MLAGTGQANIRQGCTLFGSRCQLNSVCQLGGDFGGQLVLRVAESGRAFDKPRLSYDVWLVVHGYFYSTEGNSEPSGPETGAEQFGETDRPVYGSTDIP